MNVPDLWITSLLFDLNYEFINGSFAFSPGEIYILHLGFLQLRTLTYIVFATFLLSESLG